MLFGEDQNRPTCEKKYRKSVSFIRIRIYKNVEELELRIVK